MSRSRRLSQAAAVTAVVALVASTLQGGGTAAAASGFAGMTTAAGGRGARVEDARSLLGSARLWRERGRDDLARAALDKLLAIEPANVTALRLKFAIEVEANRLDIAEGLLQDLERAHPEAPGNGELRALLAEARADGPRGLRERLRALDGEHEPGAALARSGTGRARRPRASAAAAAPAPATAPAVDHGPASATEGESPDAAAQARALRAQSEALLAQGDEPGARAALEQAVALDPRNAWTRFDLARLQQRRGEVATARATMEAGLDAAPDDADMAYAAALVYASLDADDAARTALSRIDTARWSEGMRRLGTRLEVSALLAEARAQASRGNVTATRRALEQATALAPDDPSVALRAGWTVQSVGDYDGARRYFEASARAARGDGSPGADAGALRGLDYLESLRQGFVTSGFEYSNKPGDPGISRLERRIVPVELRWALGYDRYLFAHVDHLELSSGRLDLTDFAYAAAYGSILAAGPPGPGGGVTPTATGTMGGIGYQDSHWRIDAGRLPASFPVSYAVGGVRYEDRIRELTWSVELARRPVTSTLVSFAGATDPATGLRWGGVRRTGVALGVYAKLGGRDSYAQVARYALDGENVQRNTETDVRAGHDWLALGGDGSHLTLGTGVTVWQYAHNQRYETFGHGGYYSPQSYLSLSLPAQWSGARGPWSWRLRAVLGWSTTREDDVPYHPDDAALQAAAAAQALASGLGTATYSGGHGGGFSLSTAALVEARIGRAWAVGARFEADRSEYYAPNTFGLWFRYRFNERGTLWGTPRAPAVYAYY